MHWALQRHFSFRFEEERIWRDAWRVRFGDLECRAISDEYQLVAQILGVLTDLQVGKLTLKPFVDMYWIIEQLDDQMDWEEFFLVRRRERLFAISVYALALFLRLLDCAEDCPRLAATLDRFRDARSCPDASAMLHVLRSDRLATRQKLAALRLYETSLPGALGWWLVSLPFRLAVYGEG